jgi:hypothetical protein
VRAKPELVPDCDIHGEPMSRGECPASELGLRGSRDMIVWRCGHAGCKRYFEGAVGYRDCSADGGEVAPPRCPREGAFLVLQRAMGSYVCPVDGCKTVQSWRAPEHAFRTGDRQLSVSAL